MTPDSFSGDGFTGDVEEITRKALIFQELGADIIDVGGESTRPPNVYDGAIPVDIEEELSRVIPAVTSMSRKLTIPISVDTYKAEVARQAISAGASMVNDVWALQHDPGMAEVVAQSGVPVVLMHNQDLTCYDDLIPEMVQKLRERVEVVSKSGIGTDKIILDPGIGFGKNPQQNLEILHRLGEFSILGQPLLVGTSRKSTIGYVLDLPVDDRLEGTAATVALSIAGGADMVRVHDVKQMVRVVRMSDAIVRSFGKT